jgi:hypothetical protein
MPLPYWCVVAWLQWQQKEGGGWVDGWGPCLFGCGLGIVRVGCIRGYA